MSPLRAIFRLLIYMPGSAACGSALLAIAGQRKGLAGGRGSVLTQAVSVLSGTKDQTVPVRRFGTPLDAGFGQTLRLEECSDQCEAGNVPWLARQGVSALLALEVARWEATVAERYSAIDCGDGS